MFAHLNKISNVSSLKKRIGHTKSYDERQFEQELSECTFKPNLVSNKKKRDSGKPTDETADLVQGTKGMVLEIFKEELSKQVIKKMWDNGGLDKK